MPTKGDSAARARAPIQRLLDAIGKVAGNVYTVDMAVAALERKAASISAPEQEISEARLMAGCSSEVGLVEGIQHILFDLETVRKQLEEATHAGRTPEAEAIVAELAKLDAPINSLGRCELCGARFPGADALGGGLGRHDERCPWQLAQRWEQRQELRDEAPDQADQVGGLPSVGKGVRA